MSWGRRRHDAEEGGRGLRLQAAPGHCVVPRHTGMGMGTGVAGAGRGAGLVEHRRVRPEGDPEHPSLRCMGTSQRRAPTGTSSFILRPGQAPTPAAPPKKTRAVPLRRSTQGCWGWVTSGELGDQWGAGLTVLGLSRHHAALAAASAPGQGWRRHEAGVTGSTGAGAGVTGSTGAGAAGALVLGWGNWRALVQGTGCRDVVAGHWVHWCGVLGALEAPGALVQGLG